MAATELSIKLVIDTKAHKVCFAEAGSDFVEFLSSLLCLPISNIINLLTKEHMVGSIANVFDSVEKLDADHVISNESKEPYLKPMVAPGALCPLQQLIDAQLNADTSFFTCQGTLIGYYGFCVACGYFTVMKGSICPKCGYAMEKETPHVKATGFVVGTARYTVKDDLSIVPASSVSTISLLAQCGVKDLSTLQERTVKIGKEEALEILLASLRSKTVLTDVLLKKKVSCKREASHVKIYTACYYFESFVQVTYLHSEHGVVLLPVLILVVLDSSPSHPSSLPSQDGVSGSGSGGHQRRSIVSNQSTPKKFIEF
uniref:Uncharacterized protein n=1 Tax=Oryza punctata TaxID=4537 RepID=A0A0E0JE72_ORYPU